MSNSEHPHAEREGVLRWGAAQQRSDDPPPRTAPRWRRDAAGPMALPPVVPAAAGASGGRSPLPAVVRFEGRERAFLLRQRGIAEGVLAGLEAMSIASIQAMARVGADELCRRMHAAHGWNVWGNRRRALESAIDAAVAAGLADRTRHPSMPRPGRAFAGT